MKFIKLTQNQVAIVDNEDFELVNQHKWHTTKTPSGKYYARKSVHNGENNTLYLHVFLINPPNGFIVDHKNHNGLDCTRNNLRIATKSQNGMNQEVRIGDFSSKYKGVYWCRFRASTNKWKAQIKANGKRISLGLFDNELDAAIAYDMAAMKYFGEFAVLNILEKNMSCGRSAGYSIGKSYIKIRFPNKVSKSEMEKFIKTDRFSQKVIRECGSVLFWEGINESLNEQYGGYQTRIFTSSFKLGEDLEEGRKGEQSRKTRAQIGL